MPDHVAIGQPGADEHLPRIGAALPDGDAHRRRCRAQGWVADTETTVVFTDQPPANVADLERLAWVQLGSHGYAQLSGLPLPADTVVTNASGVQDRPIAEWVVMMLLALGRRFPDMLAAQRAHRWDRSLVLPGRAARYAGRHARLRQHRPRGRRALLQPLGMPVSGADQDPQPATAATGSTRSDRSPTPSRNRTAGSPSRTVTTFYSGIEALVVAVPDSAGTRGLVDAHALATLPRGALLLNPARRPGRRRGGPARGPAVGTPRRGRTGRPLPSADAARRPVLGRPEHHRQRRTSPGRTAVPGTSSGSGTCSWRTPNAARPVGRCSTSSTAGTWSSRRRRARDRPPRPRRPSGRRNRRTAARRRYRCRRRPGRRRRPPRSPTRRTPSSTPTDLVVAPGFVDIHTHSDLTLLSSPQAPSALTQGTTTQVVGNCGLGVAPRTPEADLDEIRASAAYLDLDPDVRVDWTTIGGYLDTLRSARPALNVLTLVPHGPVRASAVGFDARPATAPEIGAMVGLVAEGLQDGAVGLSTGLVYAPVCFAEEDELVALGRTVAAHDRLFAWHVRDYTDHLLESVAQCLRVARATGCRTQVSHLAAVGRRNWGRVEQALETGRRRTTRRPGRRGRHLPVPRRQRPSRPGRPRRAPGRRRRGATGAAGRPGHGPRAVRRVGRPRRRLGRDAGQLAAGHAPTPACWAARSPTSRPPAASPPTRWSSTCSGATAPRPSRSTSAATPTTSSASCATRPPSSPPTGWPSTPPARPGGAPRTRGATAASPATSRSTAGPTSPTRYAGAPPPPPDESASPTGAPSKRVPSPTSSSSTWLPSRTPRPSRIPHQLSTGIRDVVVSGRLALRDGRLTGMRAGQVVALGS